jgi:hypothetical protein
MEVLHPRCAGLDIHKDSVVACARIAEGARVVRHVETFATTTADLERLSAWLKSHGVTQVVMEATGVYWKPVWAVLCEEMERALALANAAHVKAVPGRKTDVNDATWLADLLAHGLIRPSFVPPADVQALRDLTRTRKQFIRERSGHVQRIDKLLQGANLKLGSVLSDIMGQGGPCWTRWPRARAIRSGSPIRCAPKCARPAPRWSRPCGDGWARTSAWCSASIWRRRTQLRPPSPNWTGKWATASRPFATLSPGFPPCRA